MAQAVWRLQDAKARFSAVVEAALEGTPQHVTRRGKEAVVVLSEAEYRRLRRSARAAAPGFVQHLLAIPKRANPPALGRAGPALRDIGFDE